jgi:hypothetical protein
MFQPNEPYMQIDSSKIVGLATGDKTNNGVYIGTLTRLQLIIILLIIVRREKSPKYLSVRLLAKCVYGSDGYYERKAIYQRVHKLKLALGETVNGKPIIVNKGKGYELGDEVRCVISSQEAQEILEGLTESEQRPRKINGK